jgi:membrane-associated phospholipid phosphatase
MVLASCIVLVAVGAVFAAGQPDGTALDRTVDSWVDGYLGPDHAALSLISDLGPYVLYALAAVLLVVSLAARQLNRTVLAVTSVLIASGLTELVLKPLVQERLRGYLSYPSGTTANAFALVAIIAVLLRDPRLAPWPAWLRALILVAGAAVGCALAVAMIGLNYHYFTDTVAGAAVGTGVVLAMAFGLDRPGARRRLHLGG